MSRERRLGRGLEALLGRVSDSSEVDASIASTDEVHIGPPAVQAPVAEPVPDGVMTHDDKGQGWLAIYAIDRNPFQPREEFNVEAIDSLVESIQQHGVLQPLVVRQVGERFQLITGERRFRAATKAGWERVPVQVREADDRQMAELAIVENVQRKDLNPLEKAVSFSTYLEKYECTQDELAKRIQIDRSTISNLIRLLDLPDAIKTLLRTEVISQGHARALLPLGEETEQIRIGRRIIEEGLSVRAVEEAVSERIRKLDGEPFAVVGADGTRREISRTRSSHVESLEQDLKSALGTKVEIKQSAKHKGRITIHFKNQEEFDRVFQYLKTGQSAERAAGM